MIVTQPALGASTLTTAAPVEGSVDKVGGSKVVPIEVAAGDYLEGWIQSGDAAFDVTLQDGRGVPLRRLLTASTGKRVFRFVAEMAPLSIRVDGAGAGHFELGLSRRVARADQRPPVVEYQSPTISRIARDVAAGGKTDAFWDEIREKGTPLIEPHGADKVVMTFLVRGAERNVRLLGGPAPDHIYLDRILGSDIWFKSFIVPDSTRLSYQIAPDIPDFPGNARERRVAILATAQVDPFNKHPWPADAPDRFNQKSRVDLPNAPVQPGLSDAPVRAGTVTAYRFRSERLGNERTITLYRPADFDARVSENVLLIVFDGQEYMEIVPTPKILDQLIGQRRLPPTLAVFISNPDGGARTRDLSPTSALRDAIALELMPWITKMTGLKAQASRTILAGSSFGGLASATVALSHPKHIGNVIALSGSFWWHPVGAGEDRAEYVAGIVAHDRRRPVRFFLSAGLFEGSRDGSLGILETSRHLRDLLEAKGYDVIYREYAAGHDYYAWRGALGDGLLALFGTAREPGHK